MSYTSTPLAPAGERWFQTTDLTTSEGGMWHLGRVPAGKTWPVSRARCGYEQSSIVVGSQQTAASISGRAENICTTCLASLRAELDQARAG